MCFVSAEFFYQNFVFVSFILITKYPRRPENKPGNVRKNQQRREFIVQLTSQRVSFVFLIGTLFELLISNLALVYRNITSLFH